MTWPVFTRPAFALAAGFAFTLTGCGQPVSSQPSGKSAASSPGTPSAAKPTNAGSPGPVSPAVPSPTLLKPHDPIQQAAEKFVTDLAKAAAANTPFPADLTGRIAPDFLKAIGKPVLSPTDKARGYSADAAEAWLRRAGGALTGIGLPTGYGSPVAAVFVGSVGNGSGRFLLRLVQAGSGWQVDWFQLGTAKAAIPTPPAGEGPYQDFAVQAFLDSLTTGPTSRDDRVLLLGDLLSPKARQDWAAPGTQDKERGYDYNPAKLALLADTLGKGLTAYTRTPAGPEQFQVELTRNGTTTLYRMKLTKGASPGEWLVDEFAPQ